MCEKVVYMQPLFQLRHKQETILVLASQLISFSFPLTEPIGFESLYQREMSGNTNGQALFAGGIEDMMRRCATNNLGGAMDC